MQTRRLVGVFLLLAFAAGAWATGGTERASATTAEAKVVGPYYNPDNQLSDLRVRKAIAYAIDMDKIVKTIFQGMAIVADSQIPNGPWKVAGLEKYSYDPDKARRLLKEAGWDSNRVLDLVYYYSDQQTVDLLTTVQSYLADVGIKMTFRKLEGDVGGALRVPPKDPVKGPAGIQWDIGYGANAPLALQNYYITLRTGLSAYAPGNAELDALIDAISGSADVQKQRAAFFEIEKWHSENLPELPLYYQPLFLFQSKRVNGIQYGNAQYNYDWGIINWTVPPDASGKQVLRTNTGPIEFFEMVWGPNPGWNMASKVLHSRLITADGALTPTRGQLAQSYTVAADGMSVTFELRNNLKWHDGSPLTVEDVKWSVEFASKVPTLHGVISNTFRSLEGYKAYVDGTASSIPGITTSGNRITFKFAVLDPNMLLSFTQFPPLPKKLLQGADPVTFQQHPYWQKPVGSGPFRVSEVQMNDYLVMVPFRDYCEGVAKIDQIVCYPSFENDANVVKNAAAGNLDYGYTKNVADVVALQAMGHMRVIPVDVPYTRAFWFNQFPRK